MGYQGLMVVSKKTNITLITIHKCHLYLFLKYILSQQQYCYGMYILDRSSKNNRTILSQHRNVTFTYFFKIYFKSTKYFHGAICHILSIIQK